MINRFLAKFVARFITLIVAFLVPLSASMANESQRLAKEPLEIVSGQTVHKFSAEVAKTGPERAMGLMFRQEMDADHGMLFVFETEREQYFWMKNTPLPLDIIYIDAVGRIVSIAENTVPFSEKAIPSGQPAQFVFEINAGLSAKLGIAAGDVVNSASISAVREN